MSSIEFSYHGVNTVIQCNPNDKFSSILNKLATKTDIDFNSVYILYSGNMIKDKELSFNQIANASDKARNKMAIAIVDSEDKDNDSYIKSEQIICPECKEKIIIKINDYLISLYGCSKGHNFKNLFLDQYEKTQKVNLSQLICFNHKEKNKGNTYKNLLYRCISCEKNFCSICKDNHDKTHNIGNYDEKEYKCIKHDETFIKYCKDCKKNLCYKCKNEHKKHDIVSFEDIEPDLDEKKEELKKLRNLIDNLNIDVQNIIKKLNKIIQNIEIYYNTYFDMINNYENIIRNYEIIQSLNEMNNNIIIKDIEEIHNDKNIYNKFNYLLNIYDKMNNNEINGYKTELYDNGNKYIGEFKNGLRNGKGTMFYKNSDKYEGEWKDGNREGNGIYYFNNGESKGNKYVGEWKNNLRNGKGIFYFNNGDRYDGDWKDNKWDGKGIYYYENGTIFDGDFKNGLFEGKGIIYYKSGNREMGDYKNDKKIGNHVMLYANGEVNSQVY